MIPAEITKLLRLLSPTELRILALLARGLSSNQIAERTHTSVATVKKHRENLRTKLSLTGGGHDALLVYALTHREALN
jgi:DNA-binding NarL/FixJ family response regulator